MLIDSQGIIREKLFYAGYKVRHDSKEILAAAAKLDRPTRPRDSQAPTAEARSPVERP